MSPIVEQSLSAGEGRDDQHPVENILPVQVIFTPMLLYPGGVLRVDDQFRGGDDGILGKDPGFNARGMVAGLPGGLQVLDPPQVEHGAKKRPFSA